MSELTKRSWINEPAMYVFTRKGKILRLIKGPDGRWSREDPRALSPVLIATDFASLEQALWDQIQGARSETR